MDKRESPEAGIGGPDAWTGGPGAAPRERSDDELARAVSLALALEPEVDETCFEVRSDEGVVHLFGIAASEREHQHAVQAAETVAGVVRVEDEVRVQAKRR